jgi:hypothetical protein
MTRQQSHAFSRARQRSNSGGNEAIVNR